MSSRGGGSAPEPRSFAAYRLPPGRHGIPPEQVAEIQRWRMLGGCAEVLATKGYGQAATADVIRAAAVSSSTFYREFDDLRDCVRATYEMAAEGLIETVSQVCGDPTDGGPGNRNLHSGVAAAVEYLATEPSLAHVLAQTGLPGTAEARSTLIEELGSMRASARREVVPGDGHPVCGYLVAGALVWVADRIDLLDGDASELSELAGELSDILTGDWVRGRNSSSR